MEAIEEASWVVEGGDAHDLQDACDMAHASMADALAYIKQLESNDSQVKKTLSDNGFASLEAFLQAYNQVKKERDAAVADLKEACAGCSNDTLCCNYCKHQEDDLQCHHDCKMYTKEWDWQWRGVCESNGGTP